MTFFEPQSFLGFSTRRRLGQECVRLLIARVLNRCCVVGKRLGYCHSPDLEGCGTAQTMCLPTVADDEDFFHRVKTNSNHVLQPYLPDKTDIPYRLRTRSHNMTLINKTKFLTDADFLIRTLYKYSY